MNNLNKTIIAWALVSLIIWTIILFTKYLDDFVANLDSNNSKVIETKVDLWNQIIKSDSTANLNIWDNKDAPLENELLALALTWKIVNENTDTKLENENKAPNKSIWFEIYNNFNPDKPWEENLDRDLDLLTNNQETSWFQATILIYREGNCNEIESSKTISLTTDPNNRDSDNDWIGDWKEIILNLNPNLKDTDWDSIADWIELRDMKNPNCKEQLEAKYIDTDWDWLFDSVENASSYWIWKFILNASKQDSDSDWIADWMEDFDNDGLNNLDEQNIWTNLISQDSDKDWQSDFEELKLWSDPLNPYSKMLLDNSWLFEIFKNKYLLESLKQNSNTWSLINISMQDLDSDWLSNIDEQKIWTNPNNKDTDWDWILDWNDTDALTCNSKYICEEIDSDWDWISDKKELTWWIWFWSNTYYTNYLIKDTDWDSLSDWYEKNLWSNPMNEDTDWDWFLDWVEVTVSKIRWIDPSVTLEIKDRDNDGISDEWAGLYDK